MRCPHCFSDKVEMIASAFVEIGRYDHSRDCYEVEGPADVYGCECGRAFADLENSVANAEVIRQTREDDDEE